MSKYILAIDQGTTGTTTVLYDRSGQPVAKAYREFTQYFPGPGLVEHLLVGSLAATHHRC